MAETIKLTLKVWRQPSAEAPGNFETYRAENIDTDMSFLEMLDVVNEQIQADGGEPIAFDHDCREGICGMCGLNIQGVAHGPRGATTTCELRMRHFKDGETVTVEPFRAKGFPVIKDCVVDRTAFDRIMGAGGFITSNVGSAPDGNAVLISKKAADKAMDAAECIGCGACVAACPNASASLFTAAKISHLSLLPQGQPERGDRARKMVAQMDAEGFGSCTNHRECEAACPKEIDVAFIARMNRDFVRSMVVARKNVDKRKGGE